MRVLKAVPGYTWPGMKVTFKRSGEVLDLTGAVVKFGFVDRDAVSKADLDGLPYTADVEDATGGVAWIHLDPFPEAEADEARILRKRLAVVVVTAAGEKLDYTDAVSTVVEIMPLEG